MMTDEFVTVDAHDVEQALAYVLDHTDDALLLADDDEAVHVESVTSLADDGVMTANAGLVLRLSDGSEFQLTIVRR